MTNICRDCWHHRKRGKNRWCRHSKAVLRTNPVTGSILIGLCETMRENRCGPSGRWFLPRPPWWQWFRHPFSQTRIRLAAAALLATGDDEPTAVGAAAAVPRTPQQNQNAGLSGLGSLGSPPPALLNPQQGQ